MVAYTEHQMVGPAPTASIGAFELLEESEAYWSSDPSGALRSDGSIDSQHRRKLVVEALRAYDQLRADQAPAAAPLAVFRRWPACTFVATVALAAADVHGISERWLRGWAECRQHLLTSGEGPEPQEVAGLPQLLTASGLATTEPELPALRLDLDRGLVILSAGRGTDWKIDTGTAIASISTAEGIVTTPAPVIECRDLFGHLRFVPCVDSDDPLLVFDSNGIITPRGHALPAGEVWLLHRDELTDAAFRGGRHIVQETPPPPGWAGWCLTQANLEETRAIRSVPTPGEGVPGPWRQVGSATVDAELEFDTPIHGVTDLEGKPVYACAPRLRLPTGTWRVAIAQTDASERTRLVTKTGPTVFALAELLPRPMIGMFHVRIESTGSTSIERTFTGAEGLLAQTHAKLRMFRADGTLYSSRVQLSTPAGWRAVPPVVRLSPTQVRAPLELRPQDNGTVLKLLVELPHAALRKRVGNQPTDWAVSPLAYTLDELHQGAQLDLRLPAEASTAWGKVPTLEAKARAENGNPIQCLDGHRVPSNGVARYQLARLADTVRELGGVWLWLVLAGEDACIGTVSVPPPASDVVCDGDNLRLAHRARYVRLRVAVYSCYAPWAAPQTVELAESVDEVELVPPFRCGGPLLVTLTPADAPAPGGWPDQGTLPHGAALFHVGEHGQVPALRDPDAAAVSSYLAGQATLPETRRSWPLLWVVSARATTIFGAAFGRATAHECANRMAANPVAALCAAGGATLSTTELIEPLVRSGIPASRFRSVPEPDLVRRMWSRAPLPALLLTSPLLPYLGCSAHWDTDELDPEEATLLEELGRWCSPEAVDVLAGNTAIDFTAIEDPLLTGEDFSTTARTPLPAGMGGVMGAALLELEGHAESSRYLPLFAAFVTNTGGQEHAMVRACSRGLALLARTAAQGDQDAAALEPRLRHLWVDFAAYAPDLVATDLALAEFVVSGWVARGG